MITLEKNTVTVRTIVIKEEMKYEGETVLTYKIEYPEFSSQSYQMSLAMISSYYRIKALAYQQYLQNDLYAQAVQLYKDSIENGYPVRVFEALTVYKLTYKRACIISLYFDKYEYTGGAHGNTIRSSQTWNLQKGSKVRLEQLFGCGLNYKVYILRLVKSQIEMEPDIYFEDYEKLLVETFNEESFYCTYEGIVVYYQQYDIAPYSSGIREFLIPYTNCVHDPIRTCFVR